MNISDFEKARRDRAQSNTELKPEDALLNALEDLQNGEEKASALLIIGTNRDGDSFTTVWWAANLSSSEMLSLMEMTKATLLRDMGLT